MAINRVSDLSPAIFSSWSTSPPLDTIALIGLPAGSQAMQNNFSEVRIFTIPIIPPPEYPPSTPPVAIVPPPQLPPPVLTPPAPLPQAVFFQPSAPLVPQIGYTWHLSVVDAGQPRAASDAGNAVFFTASTKLRVTAFSDDGVNAGAWRFAGSDDVFTLGMEGGTPIAGDFNGDGVDEIGVYLDGEWFIDLNGNGVWDSDDLWAQLGDEEDRPVVGDWDGDGKDDIGIFGPIWDRDPLAIRHDPGLPEVKQPALRQAEERAAEARRGHRRLAGDAAQRRGTVRHDLIDHVFLYGQASDVPVAGDWNGDGITAIGVFRNGRWQLDTDGDGRFTASDETAYFGAAGDRPVVGDFNGDGVDELGVYRGGHWIIDTNGNREIDAQDQVFELGGAAICPSPAIGTATAPTNQPSSAPAARNDLPRSREINNYRQSR